MRRMMLCVFVAAAMCVSASAFAAPLPEEWMGIEFPLQPLQGDLEEGWERCGTYFARGSNVHHPEAKYMVKYEPDTGFIGGINATMAFCLNVFRVVTDDSKSVPTAEPIRADGGHNLSIVVRLSSQEYEIARGCLSLPETGAVPGEQSTTRVVDADTQDMSQYEGVVTLAPLPSFTTKDGEEVFQCGDYFFLQLSDNRVVCVFHPDGDAERWGGLLYPFETYRVVLDDTAVVPAAELRHMNDEVKREVTIRLSREEFRRAHACLPRPPDS